MVNTVAMMRLQILLSCAHAFACMASNRVFRCKLLSTEPDLRYGSMFAFKVGAQQ